MGCTKVLPDVFFKKGADFSFLSPAPAHRPSRREGLYSEEICTVRRPVQG